jgi:DNA-3-methyladenine glycosylase II
LDKEKNTRTHTSAVAQLKRADPVLGRVIDAQPDFDPRAWLSGLPPMDAFGAIVFQVAGQQLSIRASRAILERLSKRFGNRLPTPSEFLSVSPEELRGTGMSRKKVSTLRDVAERFADGRLDPRELKKLSDDEIEARLTTISGIGPWTAQGVLIIAFDRDDVLLPGDLALRKIIQRIYRLDDRPTPDDVVAIAKAWRPHRSLAVAYLFQYEFNPTDAPAVSVWTSRTQKAAQRRKSSVKTTRILKTHK